MKYLLPLFLLLFTVSINAATFTVVNLNDSGTGSLRQAIRDAELSPDNDAIIFAPGLSGGITLTSGELLVNSNINITTAAVIVISGNNTSRVFNFTANSDSVLDGIRISGGFAFSTQETVQGGGIWNRGNLTVKNCSISSNMVSTFSGFGDGGGIANSGSLNLIDSTVFGNTGRFTNSNGGGIYNSGNLFVSGSIISSNGAGRGGGIFGSSMTLRNSTISSNFAIANNGGGGINGGGIDAQNITVANNYAYVGYGILLSGNSSIISNSTIYHNIPFGLANSTAISIISGVLTLKNSIVDNNSSDSPSTNFQNINGTVNSLGNNLINGTGNSTGWIASDILNQPTKLAHLSEVGGRTSTVPLLPGSPAIDAGNNSGAPETDQRGFARISNGIIDIGAFEVQQAPTAANVTVSGRVITQSGRGIRNVLIILTDANGQTRTAQTTAFGYYRFDDVTAGETVTLSAKARRFRFNQSSIVRTTNDSITDADFVSER